MRRSASTRGPAARSCGWQSAMFSPAPVARVGVVLMNRETQVGIVVAASFLVLVGIVVASKWRGRTEDPTTDPSEAQSSPKVAAIKPTQNGAEAKKETGAKNEGPKAG